MINSVLSGLLTVSASAVVAQAELPKTYDALVDMAFNHVIALQTAHNAAWSMDEHTNFDLDLQAGTIIFFMGDGTQARADAQLLGTWDPNDGSFLWGWDHPSAPPGTATATAAMRDYAETHDIAELTTGLTRCEFDECYRVAATAVLVADMQGIYRFDAGGPWAYIGFGNITLSGK